VTEPNRPSRTRAAIAVALALAGLFATFAPRACAFDGHVVTEGPLRLTIAELPKVTEYDKPCPVEVTLANSSPSPLKVKLQLTGLVDQWHPVGQTERLVTVGPLATAKASFRIAAGQGAYSALYPVHIEARFDHDSTPRLAHAVQVFQTDFARAPQSLPSPTEMPVNNLPPDTALPLWTLDTHRLAWAFYEEPLVYTRIGFAGTVPESFASFSRGPVTRGTTKNAICMHPPWKPRGGTVFAEYLLGLPRTTPLKLIFANAIRDNTPAEPPSDGVTFRVWAGREILFERHTASKKWLAGQVDLTRFAGKQLLLRLECHPGPERDTTCDSAYWGEPILVAGSPPPRQTEAERRELRNRARQLVTSARKPTHGEFLFELDGGCSAAVVLGRMGLVDSAIAFGKGHKSVVFDGLRISILRRELAAHYSPLPLRTTDAARDSAGRLTIRHRLALAGEEFDLAARIWKDGPGLRVCLQCPKRITKLSPGPADQKAPRVYYGHGYCIVEPEAFRAAFGGHNLSTSHVGFDFDQGISLLMASDNPPDFLEIDPYTRTYALVTHLNATMTFVPGDRGAFDCARRYHPLYDKKPSPGFARKAGRFVFDIWGGRYAEIAQTIKRMVCYGLTDSLLTVHVWQRWGYDYRLPDIYPPQPGLGTIDDMNKIADICAQHNIPWGLHDNYIDFYPDAQGYSYKHICFTEHGEPIKAWLNEWRRAQSYRWRPDHIMPFVQRNLRLIKPNLKPTHYFIDVFASIGCFDFYDRHGNFHSMLETRRCWGQAFAWIRDYLGGNAPMTSEAGHDQLTGYIAGSDCQHLRITPQGKRFCIGLACKDWERVPWFDAVLHDKFSLHGVGYSSRYQGGRSRRAHGIESDDYISAEILEGHALMIDRPALGRGAVRKYWLAQDFIRSIATDTIEDLQFVDGDIHRQLVTWKSGAKVYVNRGTSDWCIAGKHLPQYGYYASNGPIESSIERIDGVIVEQSRSTSGFYVNSRTAAPGSELPIRPTAESLEYLGGRRFKLVLAWDARRPAPKDLSVFVHYSSDKAERQDKIAFQGGGKPALGTSKWTGRVRTGTDHTVGVPDQYGPGEYEITVGLWDPATGRRYPLMGTDDGTTRYRLGKLIVEGSGRNVTGIRLEKYEPSTPPAPRWNIAGVPIDFGPVRTDGALRCQYKDGHVVITPLPDSKPFTVRLSAASLPPTTVESVDAVDATGRTIRNVSVAKGSDYIEFETRENEFAYVIRKDTK